ncbi:ESX secretion-associated protein EspG [Amycolatopsis suaedae]|uniref:ESX secretion-associated protein EspG n=1 Tax=Amycolatopsis suaedae TaxID=2510978 RepID=A0A4Q7J7L4_9PSEU|nr:ESX secretion-associated protein EspG [Amycolatopsis suaedae]RZQ62034.1 ESX secretion-associated protein EspG [Amycolatopsis suaedae]
MAHSFSLSLAAVDILLDLGKLGPAPFPFEVPHLGTTHEQRAAIRDAVYRDLDSRGLMFRGRLDPDAEVALRTFVASPVAIVAAGELDDGKPLFARVAADRQFAVLVQQKDNMLVFEEVRPTGIVPAIVDLLPLTSPGPGQSVTVARPSRKPKPRHRQEDSYDPFAGVSGPRSQSSVSSQMRAIERIFEKPKLRIGQFTAFVRDDRGAEVDMSPLAWFDNEDGRYLVTMRDAEDGQQWVTYAPADNARIGQQLYSQVERYLS